MIKFECPNCNFKSSKVEIRTTEIGQVRWLNPRLNSDGIIENLGEKWIYEGGEILEKESHRILCKKCGSIIKSM